MLISLFSSLFHRINKVDWKFNIRIFYLGLALAVDIISSFKKIKSYYIHVISWTLSLITLFPFPLYKSKDNNILLKTLLYILPFYLLLTRSYESLYLLLFYDYLQLWIKMNWRMKESRKYNFNLIDIFMYMSLIYSSVFSTGNIASISGFTLSSVFRFASKYLPIPITILIMIKILLPTFFVTFAHFEICKIYNYSSIDSLFMLIAMCEIMNIKFFFEIRDFGSWREIGMSIAFFVISNVISFVHFIMFLCGKFLFWLDMKINNIKDLDIKEKLPKQNLVDYEGNILIK